MGSGCFVGGDPLPEEKASRRWFLLLSPRMCLKTPPLGILAPTSQNLWRARSRSLSFTFTHCAGVSPSVPGPRSVGRGQVGEKPGRQEAPPAPTQLPVSSSRAVSPTVHALGPGHCWVHLQLTLQSKLFCSLKPKKHMELNKERSLCFHVWPTGHLCADRLNGSSSHGSRKP